MYVLLTLENILKKNKMKKFNLLKMMSMLLAIAAISFMSCTKEGPAGKDGLNGQDGQDGQDGTDGTAGCIQCHAPDVVDLVAVQYDFSKHHYGEAAFDESGSTGCSPCHASEAFKYVVENNVPATFSPDPANAGKYKNDYATVATDAYGEINCSTCHSSLHTTYGVNDLGLTTVAPVSMTMWGAAKTIDLTADGGRSNLCVKCHQPRPLTNSAGDRNVLDYAALVADPDGIFFDPNGTTTKIKPGYRTHTHYGTAGAIFAGMGGIEFPGSLTYENSAHTTAASCQDCHMATINGRAGGHTFFAADNFNGCNATDCHSGIDATSSPFWTTPREDVKGKLEELASLLAVNGIDILNRNPDSETNLWAANTSNKYDGYLNIYDPVNNPDGVTNNPTGIFQNPSPSNSWTQEQKDYNLTLPQITLTNGQMGAIINFQLCLRDFSLGIHNYSYTMALLTNSVETLN
jgi:hypothetical protein